MRVPQSDETHVALDLSHNELILLNNALNEVCNGLEFLDFSTRLGGVKETNLKPFDVKSRRRLKA
jgi:hypothetical protein